MFKKESRPVSNTIMGLVVATGIQESDLMILLNLVQQGHEIQEIANIVGASNGAVFGTLKPISYYFKAVVTAVDDFERRQRILKELEFADTETTPKKRKIETTKYPAKSPEVFVVNVINHLNSKRPKRLLVHRDETVYLKNFNKIYGKKARSASYITRNRALISITRAGVIGQQLYGKKIIVELEDSEEDREEEDEEAEVENEEDGDEEEDGEEEDGGEDEEEQGI